MPVNYLVAKADIPLCDVCGKSSTHAVHDTWETLQSDISRAFVPHGVPRYGCDTHPVESRTYDIHGRLIE